MKKHSRDRAPISPPTIVTPSLPTHDDDAGMDLKGLIEAKKKFFKGYRINEWLIYSGFIPTIILLIAIISQYGLGNHFYYKCEGPTPCGNPFYMSEDIPEELAKYQFERNLPAGLEVGMKEPEIYRTTFLVTILDPLLMIVINHFVYNRKWRPNR